MPVSRTAITAASFSVAIVHHIFKNHRAGGQIGSPMRFRLGYEMVTGWQEFAQAEGFGDVIVGNCSLTSHLSIRLPARQLQKM